MLYLQMNVEHKAGCSPGLSLGSKNGALSYVRARAIVAFQVATVSS